MTATPSAAEPALRRSPLAAALPETLAAPEDVRASTTAAAAAAAPARSWLQRRGFYVALGCLLLMGILFRVYPSTGFTGVGFDEGLYVYYTNQTRSVGVLSYPDIVEHYMQEQRHLPGILPPTRFLYILSAAAWGGIFGVSSLTAVHSISCVFSILMLFLTAAWSWRIGGRAMCLGAVALMSCASVEIHLSQHGMIDGVFAFWAVLALWTLWECLQSPKSIGWQTAYGSALAAMVLTKENAFFVYVALMGLLALNWKLRFGTATRQLLLVSIIGPLAGVVVLVSICGGFGTMIDMYRLLVAKLTTLDYAIKTGDGPWHRYLLDLLMTSPIVLVLALGAAFQVRFNNKPLLYMLGFMVLSYTLMCNIKYGMNLRYATMWDLPLRYLALTQLVTWSKATGRYGRWVVIGGVAIICAYDLKQYSILFVEHKLHELVPSGLLEAMKVLK